MITREHLKTILRYDKDTGVFVWIKPPKQHSEKTGKVAGMIKTARNKYYVSIKINGKHRLAHRLAWLYVYGVIPKMIDHINGDSLDNRIANLRPTNNIQNTQNHTKRINKSGLPAGVRTQKNGRFLARITANHKVYSLGSYETPEEASKEYSKMRIALHTCDAAKQSGILC